MRRLQTFPAIGLAFSLAMLASVSAEAEALKTESAWARASAGRVAGVFVTIVNGSDATDRLTEVHTPVAADAMVHRSFEQDGAMKMEHLPSVEIRSGQRLEMKPGGMHIMLMGLKQPLKKGDQFPLSLRFERSGDEDVTVTVYGPGAMASE